MNLSLQSRYSLLVRPAQRNATGERSFSFSFSFSSSSRSLLATATLEIVMARWSALIGFIVIVIFCEVSSFPHGPQPDIINRFFHSSFQKLDEYFEVTEDQT